jgi:uncharacterized damage-inducible protein DinB
MNAPLTRPTRTARAGAAVLVAFALGLGSLSPAAAQHHDHGHHHHTMPTEGLRAEIIQDLDGVARKYLALADAMAGHYDWRPGDGVRSTRELLAHVAAGNFMLANMAGMPLPDGMTMDQVRAMGAVTDPARIRSDLEHSFRHLQHGIAGISDDALGDPITLFGRETTRRAALLLIATHAHEHLGQAIAYARTNGVVPPWSAGG